jgi:hypothetical protein
MSKPTFSATVTFVDGEQARTLSGYAKCDIENGVLGFSWTNEQRQGVRYLCFPLHRVRDLDIVIDHKEV